MTDLRRTPVRITGPARDKLAKAAAKRYAYGDSVRDIATTLGISYGMAHGLLREQGVVLRSRGGGRAAAK